MEEVAQGDEETISLGISFLTVAGMVDGGSIKVLTSMHKRSECSILGPEELLVDISCPFLPNKYPREVRLIDSLPPSTSV